MGLPATLSATYGRGYAIPGVAGYYIPGNYHKLRLLLLVVKVLPEARAHCAALISVSEALSQACNALHMGAV